MGAAVAKPSVRIWVLTIGMNGPRRLVTPTVRGTKGVLGRVGHAAVVAAPFGTRLNIVVTSAVVAAAMAATFDVAVTAPHVSVVDDLRSLFFALEGAASTDAQRANDCNEHHACCVHVPCIRRAQKI